MANVLKFEPDEVQPTIEENEGLLVVSFNLPVPSSEVAEKDLEEVADTFAGRIEFGQVVLPFESELIRDFALTAVPTLLLYADRHEVERVEKFWTPEALQEYLHLAESYYSGGMAG